LRPDLTFAGLRGNIGTRLEKAAEHDAIVVAAAALGWLGCTDRATEVLEPDVMVPQVAQGSLAVECRVDDEDVAVVLADLEDPLSRRCFDAERAFLATLGGDCNLPAGAFDALNAKIAELVETKPAQATRQSSGAALDELFAAIPELVGGSADLTGSNNTFVKGTPIFDAPTYEGRYVNWGIREFGMAAAMNGMALHGGIIPYGGTFMVFSDYSRPAIRLGALMGVRAIHVLTHDSIGLGEDGPTHQPVEHLAALRAIPNLLVFRPADTVEAMECWQAALEHKHAPSALALSPSAPPVMPKTEPNIPSPASSTVTSGSPPPRSSGKSPKSAPPPTAMPSAPTAASTASRNHPPPPSSSSA
jgi:hypothetical protein